ncbi:MAG TPA: MerR family transcriptional regulator [Actinomycetota bacterium]|nr:MerR family transcriptional regulator [Actinomycetota bacterium]
MPLSRSRDYLSIGEVLDAIRADFPDVSVSKIRFLESEGLIAPERTQAGYRKFYDGDVARLRYILSLQRDHFLPLRVIRERLAAADANGGVYPDEGPRRASESSGSSDGPRPAPVDVTGVQLTRDELRTAAGLSDAQLRGLEDFGVLDRRGAGEHYDENDLLVAKAAGRFFHYGVEPRHLRMYRQFAEREASFFEQIVAPVARRRDPDARREASQSVRELVGLAQQLREGALRSSLRDAL